MIPRFIFFALAVSLLSACGSDETGRDLKNSKKSNTVSSATSTTYGPTGTLTLGPCKILSVYSAGNTGAAQVLSGSSACAGINSPSVIRLKVSAYFPQSDRFCLVPLSKTDAYPEACFTVNGQIDVDVKTDAFLSVVLLAEGDVNAYKSYLRGQSSSAPPHASAYLR